MVLSYRAPRRALGIVWCYLRGKRVRAKNRLRAAITSLPDAYHLWLSCRPAASSVSSTPFVLHLSLDTKASIPAAVRTIRAVMAQSHAHWKLLIFGPVDVLTKLRISSDPRLMRLPDYDFAQSLQKAARANLSGYLVPLSASVCLDRRALATLAAKIELLPAQQFPLLYGDEDAIDDGGTRCRPWLKSAWDPELFCAQDFVSGACAIPASAILASSEHELQRVGSVAGLCALLLLREPSLEAVHVPEIIVSRPPEAWRIMSAQRRAVVSETLRIRDNAEVLTGASGTFVIRYPLQDPPPVVSVIVPTRDALDVLSVCVDGVLTATDYPALELIIADNASVDHATRRFFDDIARDPRVRIVAWPHPYNFAAINNFAARTARGKYLCFLNNDVEVTTQEWLSELMRFAARRGVGAVGPQLRYPDGTIQHAGVIMGLGNAAGHAHRGIDPASEGYFARHMVAHSVSAVTAACLVVARSTFDAVGGFDAESFAIAYNDVDLCLRIQQAGWRNCYVPQACLIHHESKTRGSDFAPAHAARYQRELALLQKRWRTIGAIDPMHHARLDPASEVYRFDVAAS